MTTIWDSYIGEKRKNVYNMIELLNPNYILLVLTILDKHHGH